MDFTTVHTVCVELDVPCVGSMSALVTIHVAWWIHTCSSRRQTCLKDTEIDKFITAVNLACHLKQFIYRPTYTCIQDLHNVYGHTRFNANVHHTKANINLYS